MRMAPNPKKLEDDQNHQTSATSEFQEMSTMSLASVSSLVPKTPSSIQVYALRRRGAKLLSNLHYIVWRLVHRLSAIFIHDDECSFEIFCSWFLRYFSACEESTCSIFPQAWSEIFDSPQQSNRGSASRKLETASGSRGRLSRFGEILF